MTTALTLLMTAMQLLTMVANTPNLSVEFKNNAIQIANQAIVVAQDEIAKSNTIQIPQITPQVTQPVLQTPVFSGIIKSMNKLSIRKNCVNDLGNENGLFCEVAINYTDQFGKDLLNQDLTITSNGTGEFVNYASPQFVSTTTNQLVIKTKKINQQIEFTDYRPKGISGQVVTYSQPSKVEPIFTVTVGELTATQ